jgi:hypothetical protein
VVVLDQLLYTFPVLAACLMMISLLSRRHWFATRRPPRRVRVATVDDRTPDRSRVVSGLLQWLAIRLMYVWVVVLIVRLASAAV